MENSKNHGSHNNASTGTKDKDMNKKSNAGQQNTHGKTSNNSGGSSSKSMNNDNDSTGSKGGSRNSSR